jgi:hypothetical protein
MESLESLMTKQPIAGILILCAAIANLSGCAARSHDPSTAQSGTRELITQTELSKVDAVDAYTAVRQLRPTWLRSRGAASFTEPRGSLPAVYVDNMPFGELATLQIIPVAEIAEIRYISGPDATTRWGTGVLGGVIEVIRKRELTKS